MASGSNQIPWPENYTELDATFDPSTFQRGLTLDDVINKALVLLNVCTISLGGMNVLLVVVIMTSSTLYSATSALLCGVLVSNACYILRLAHSMQLYVEINALTCTALLTAETWGKLSISLYTTALLAYSYLHTKARRLHRGHEAGAQHWPKVVTTMLVGCSLVAVAGTLPVVLQAKVEVLRVMYTEQHFVVYYCRTEWRAEMYYILYQLLCFATYYTLPVLCMCFCSMDMANSLTQKSDCSTSRERIAAAPPMAFDGSKVASILTKLYIIVWTPDWVQRIFECVVPLRVHSLPGWLEMLISGLNLITYWNSALCPLLTVVYYPPLRYRESRKDQRRQTFQRVWSCSKNLCPKAIHTPHKALLSHNETLSPTISAHQNGAPWVERRRNGRNYHYDQCDQDDCELYLEACENGCSLGRSHSGHVAGYVECVV